ncbi:protein of unknown function [Aminobacter niigataensis]|nr:protein of unknown function [Aminobacter niigataensis]
MEKEPWEAEYGTQSDLIVTVAELLEL